MFIASMYKYKLKYCIMNKKFIILYDRNQVHIFLKKKLYVYYGYYVT